MFCVLVLSVCLQAQPQAVDIVALSQQTVETLERGDYAAVVARFSVKLREQISVSKMTQIWDDVHRRFGKVVSAGTPTTVVKKNLRAVTIPAKFEKRSVDVEIYFNAAGEIAGLQLHRK